MNDHPQNKAEPRKESADHDTQSPDQHQKHQGGAHNPGQHAQGEQKPKTEQGSHQGGGGVRTDHKPQGPTTQK